jgi:hypothetical protein
MKTGIELIAKERRRQVRQEGWTATQDDEHEGEELARAAACYAIPPSAARDFILKSLWPESWAWEWWKPLANDPDEPRASRNAARVRELVKAGALIAAEIDRLQRATTTKEG